MGAITEIILFLTTQTSPPLGLLDCLGNKSLKSTAPPLPPVAKTVASGLQVGFLSPYKITGFLLRLRECVCMYVYIYIYIYVGMYVCVYIYI